MNIFVTYFNLVASIASMVLLLMALYRSENIFIKARTRDVREILTKDIFKYETNIRIKLIGKVIMSILFLSLSISRLQAGCQFISTTDMWVVFLISIVFLIICYIDYKFSSPENER